MAAWSAGAAIARFPPRLAPKPARFLLHARFVRGTKENRGDERESKLPSDPQNVGFICI